MLLRVILKYWRVTFYFLVQGMLPVSGAVGANWPKKPSSAFMQADRRRLFARRWLRSGSFAYHGRFGGSTWPSWRCRCWKVRSHKLWTCSASLSSSVEGPSNLKWTGLFSTLFRKTLSASNSTSMTNLSKELSPSFRGVVSSSPSQAQIKSVISQYYAHNPYLTKLQKQINASSDVNKLLVEKLDGVKIKWMLLKLKTCIQ